MKRPGNPYATITLRKSRRGFTVVELMIATFVFSIALLGVATAIMQFSRVYYKGATETLTQNTARTIVDQIAQSIQFKGGRVVGTGASAPGAFRAFCVGDLQYSYQLGHKLVEGSIPAGNEKYHALVTKNLAGCPGQAATASMSDDELVEGERELLFPNMRIANLVIEDRGNNLWRITVRIAYGEDDLLNNPTGTDASCRLDKQIGAQFCAVSDITTVVVKRVQ